MPALAGTRRSIPAMLGAMAVIVLSAATAIAQTYPAAPVRVIVPFGAGGATDVLARVFIDHLQQRMGQTFTAENRGGAGGQIAASAFARAPADGYTLMFTTAAPITIAPLLSDKVQYDPRKDFVPIAARRGPAGLANGQRQLAVQDAGRRRQHARDNPGTRLRNLGRRHRAAPGRRGDRPLGRESKWCTCRSAAAPKWSPR